MNRRQHLFATWVADHWWAGLLLGLMVLAIGVGIIVSPDQTGYNDMDISWMKYSIAPICILAGLATVVAALIRRARGPRRE